MKKLPVLLLSFFLLGIIFLSVAAVGIQAAAVSWDGGGDGTSWSSGANWDGDDQCHATFRTLLSGLDSGKQYQLKIEGKDRAGMLILL